MTQRLRLHYVNTTSATSCWRSEDVIIASRARWAVRWSGHLGFEIGMGMGDIRWLTLYPDDLRSAAINADGLALLWFYQCFRPSIHILGFGYLLAKSLGRNGQHRQRIDAMGIIARLSVRPAFWVGIWWSWGATLPRVGEDCRLYLPVAAAITGDTGDICCIYWQHFLVYGEMIWKYFILTKSVTDWTLSRIWDCNVMVSPGPGWITNYYRWFWLHVVEIIKISLYLK